MKHLMKYIAFAVFYLLTCNSCKPEYENPFRDDIIGKWKLVEVEVFRLYYQPFERQSAIIDCLNENIIYDFQPNNKFFITNSIVDTFFIADTTVVFSSLFDSSFNEGEHFYEYHKFPDPPSDPGPNLSIDKPANGEGEKRFYCNALKGEQTMTIGTGQPDGNRFGCICKLIILK